MIKGNDIMYRDCVMFQIYKYVILLYTYHTYNKNKTIIVLNNY